MRKEAIIYVGLAAFAFAVVYGLGSLIFEVSDLAAIVTPTDAQFALCAIGGVISTTILLSVVRDPNKANAQTVANIEATLKEHIKGHEKTDKEHREQLLEVTEYIKDLKVSDRLTPPKKVTLSLVLPPSRYIQRTQDETANNQPETAPAPQQKPPEKRRKGPPPPAGSPEQPASKQPENPQKPPLKIEDIQNLNQFVEYMTNNPEDPYVKDLTKGWANDKTIEQVKEWAKNNPLLKKMLEIPEVAKEFNLDLKEKTPNAV
jgi:hypothetical protein